MRGALNLALFGAYLELTQGVRLGTPSNPTLRTG